MLSRLNFIHKHTTSFCSVHITTAPINILHHIIILTYMSNLMGHHQAKVYSLAKRIICMQLYNNTSITCCLFKKN